MQSSYSIAKNTSVTSNTISYICLADLDVKPVHLKYDFDVDELRLWYMLSTAGIGKHFAIK